jgi:tetratricopeptide (TPR) repeat protein
VARRIAKRKALASAFLLLVAALVVGGVILASGLRRQAAERRLGRQKIEEADRFWADEDWARAKTCYSEAQGLLKSLPDQAARRAAECDRRLESQRITSQFGKKYGGDLDYVRRYLDEAATGSAWAEAVRNAWSVCDRIVREAPDWPQAWTERGRAAAAAGRFEDAIADYTKALDLNAGYSPARLDRALAYLDLAMLQIIRRRTGDSGAEARAQEWIRKGADDLRDGARLGWNLDRELLELVPAFEALARGDYEAVRSVRVSGVRSAKRIAMRIRGDSLLFNRDLTGAEAAYTQALEAGGTRGILHMLRAHVRRTLGRLAEALRDCDQAVAALPDESSSWSYRSVVRYHAGDFAGALADAEEVVQRVPDHSDAWSIIGAAKQKLGDPRGAIDACDRAIQLDATNAQAYNNRAFARADVGDLPGAIEDCRVAVELSQGDARAWLGLGELQCQAKDFAGALTSLSRAIEGDPSIAEAWGWRAFAHDRLGDPSSAVRDYTEAIRLDPTLPNVHRNRGENRLELHDWPGAEEDFTVAAAIDERDPVPFLYRGFARRARGLYLLAAPDFERAIALHPYLADGYGNRGWNRVALADLESGGAKTDLLRAAVVDLERFLALAPPEDPGVPHVRRLLEDTRRRLR